MEIFVFIGWLAAVVLLIMHEAVLRTHDDVIKKSVEDIRRLRDDIFNTNEYVSDKDLKHWENLIKTKVEIYGRVKEMIKEQKLTTPKNEDTEAEKEKRRAERFKKDFSSIMNYNIDTALGGKKINE